MRRLFWYTVYMVCAFIILFTGETILENIRKSGSENFNLLPYAVYSFLFYFILGMFLSIPTMMKRMNRPEKWKYDWVLFIIIFIPSVFIALQPLLLYTSFFDVASFLEIPLNYLPITSILFTVAAGYSMLIGFKKQRTA
ncbi:hypothetical protein [Falsibacillus albus]|uniref:hypothetical protein n=1 Tax=Falsibacillus albus TaxID=2478915 RepID=UPI0011E591D4|nr:hypothetical protein [Falsibacillus albus]